MKKLLLPILFLIVITSCFGQHQNTFDVTTIILVRHAEKAKEPADNPGLTEAGKQRADALAHTLANFKINAIYSTKYRRTQETVTPLADANSIKIEEYSPFDKVAFAEILKKHAGHTIVFSGHSNTVPAMLNLLVGHSEFADLPEWEYDNLYIALAENSHAMVYELQYGAPSNPE